MNRAHLLIADQRIVELGAALAVLQERLRARGFFCGPAMDMLAWGDVTQAYSELRAGPRRPRSAI